MGGGGVGVGVVHTASVLEGFLCGAWVSDKRCGGVYFGVMVRCGSSRPSASFSAFVFWFP